MMDCGSIDTTNGFVMTAEKLVDMVRTKHAADVAKRTEQHQNSMPTHVLLINVYIFVWKLQRSSSLRAIERGLFCRSWASKGIYSLSFQCLWEALVQGVELLPNESVSRDLYYEKCVR